MATTRTTSSVQACSKCGFPEADVIDSGGSAFCRIHQDLAVGTKVPTYEIRTEFPEIAEAFQERSRQARHQARSLRSAIAYGRSAR